MCTHRLCPARAWKTWGTAILAGLFSLRLLSQSFPDYFAPNANGAVRVLAVQSDNKIILGGQFTTVNGINRNHIARLNPDGSLDTSFNPGADDLVLALAVQLDRKIVVGGGFGILGSTNRSHIGRLNADGTIDASFNPGAGDLVWSLALVPGQTSPQILVGGAYTSIAGTNRGYLARLNSDGSIDASFNAGVDNQINCLLLQPDGKLLLGGLFTNVAGVSHPYLARLNTDNSLDLSFNPVPNAPVWKLALEPYNMIVLGGSFSTVAGTNRASIARVDMSGVLDPVFNPVANNTVNSLAIDTDGRILVGGSFTTLGGTGTSYLGRLNADGGLDPTFNASADGGLFSLVPMPDGRILVGGEYGTLFGLARGGLARLTFETNDDFNNAITLAGGNIAVVGSNVGATKEPGEPNHAGKTGGSSVWWTWTAPSNCLVQVEADTGAGTTPLLAVYTGASVSNLTEVVSGIGNSQPGGDIVLTFNALMGTNYVIAVDGVSLETSDILLKLSTQPLQGPPANDDFANAALISGLSNSVSGSNVGATFESGELVPDQGYLVLGGSVWWSWTAPTNAIVTLDTTGSSFDTFLDVYSGNSISSLNSLTSDDDDEGGLASTVVFSATANVTYRFAVYGVGKAAGSIVLNLSATPMAAIPPSPPANDYFANAIAITGVSNVFTGSNAGAGLETGEHPSSLHATGATVWWSFTPPADGWLQLDPTGSSIPVVICVYTGTAVTNLVSVGNNDEGLVGGSLSVYLKSKLGLNVSAGTNYHVSVDGLRPSEGNFQLGMFFTPGADNNYFANRIAVSPGTTSLSGSNVGANLEPSEPNAGPNSVWWSWTPTQNESIVFTTFGTAFNTVLSVYTNSTLATLALVARNTNAFVFPTGVDPASRVRVDATSNTTYQIQVCGTDVNYSGLVSLNLVSIALQDILASQRVVAPDRSVSFLVNVKVGNLSSNATGPLRIRLVAKAGFSCMQYLAVDPSFLATLSLAQEELGYVYLSPSTLAAGNSLETVVSTTCPPPYETGKWGFGWALLGVLEEQVGGSWQARDGRMLGYGEWPVIGGQQGPFGGVIQIISPLAGTAKSPAFLQVSVGPPAAVRMGGAWRVSPTNYGRAGELWYFTNYTGSSLLLAIQSTNFAIEIKPLPGFYSLGNQAIALSPNSLTNLNLLYSVVPPRLFFDRSRGLGMTGTVGTAYLLQSTATLASSNSWSALTNNFALNLGTNWVPNTGPVSSSNRFHRALWLTN